MNPAPLLTHEYAYMIYNKIREDSCEPTFWGEVLSKKELILAIFEDLKTSYENNAYMLGVVSRMEKVVLDEISIMEAKYSGFQQQGDTKKLHKNSLENLL